MSIRKAALLALPLLSAALYVLWPVLQNPPSPPRPERDTLGMLRSVPYLSWNVETSEKPPVGVVRHDAARAWRGYNLFTNDADRVLLMDMKGSFVHTWQVPPATRGRAWCEHAELLDDGSVLVVCVGRALYRLDWESRVVWEVRARVNHEVAVLPDGSLLTLVNDAPRAYHAYRHVMFDSILRLLPDGAMDRRWSTFDNLAMLQRYHPPSELDRKEPPESEQERRRPYDYYHVNSIQPLPETRLAASDRRFRPGNLLICLRNADLVLILDQDTWEVVWHWGPGELDYPHMPRMLDNGDILIFDNGAHRGYSRIVQVDPIRKQVVWEHRANPPEAFYSKWRGSSQRLANGNTLICESEKGRAFEVTPSGEIVWEFWNPEVKEGKRKRIYRLLRIAPTRVARLLTKYGSGRVAREEAPARHPARDEAPR